MYPEDFEHNAGSSVLEYITMLNLGSIIRRDGLIIKRLLVSDEVSKHKIKTC